MVAEGVDNCPIVYETAEKTSAPPPPLLFPSWLLAFPICQTPFARSLVVSTLPGTQGSFPTTFPLSRDRRLLLGVTRRKISAYSYR